MTVGMTAAERWRSALQSLAIPREILDQAPEDPWRLPRSLFVMDAGTEFPSTPSRERAMEVLPPEGTVLDVGCGGGRASLALVPPAGRITGVDERADMLAEFSRAAGALGVAAEAIRGRWPEVCADDSIEPCDVVVCHHVVYNVADLVPFVTGLTRCARTRVVLELTDRHPRAGLAELWRALWGIERPEGPDARDAADVVRESGIDPFIETFELPAWPGGGREAVVATVRRHLCAAPQADAEIDRLLPRGFGIGAQPVTCMWWPGGAPS